VISVGVGSKVLSNAILEVAQTGGGQGNVGSPEPEKKFKKFNKHPLQAFLGNELNHSKRIPGHPFHTGERICRQPLKHLL